MRQLTLALVALLLLISPTWAEVTDQQRAIIIRSALLDEADWPVDLVVDGQHNLFWPNRAKYLPGLEKGFEQNLLKAKNGRVFLNEGVTDDQLLAIPEFREMADQEADKAKPISLDTGNWLWPVLAALAIGAIGFIGFIFVGRKRSSLEVLEEEPDPANTVEAEIVETDGEAKEAEDQTPQKDQTPGGEVAESEHHPAPPEIRVGSERSQLELLVMEAEAAKRTAEKHAEQTTQATLRVGTLLTEVKRQAENAEAAAQDASEARKEAAQLLEETRLETGKMAGHQAEIKTAIEEAMEELEDRKTQVENLLEEARLVIEASIKEKQTKLPTLDPAPQKMDPDKLHKPYSAEQVEMASGGLMPKTASKKGVSHPITPEMRARFEGKANEDQEDLK